MKGRFEVVLVLSMLAVGLLAACGAQSAEVQPPEIVYGQDMCDVCGMLISEPHFASALVLENGDPVKFDDTGEMFAYAASNPDLTVKAWFVHDYNTEAWVNGEAAYYVHVPGMMTPMGFGLASFEAQEAAQTFAAEQNVDVLTFEEVLANPPSGMGMGR